MTSEQLLTQKERPLRVCMCGSTRFGEFMAMASWELEKAGHIVLRVNFLPDWYSKFDGWTEYSHGAEQSGLKEQLDQLHLHKIDLADIVYIFDYNGYIGDSTAYELKYALANNKLIVYLTKDHSMYNKIKQAAGFLGEH